MMPLLVKRFGFILIFLAVTLSCSRPATRADTPPAASPSASTVTDTPVLAATSGAPTSTPVPLPPAVIGPHNLDELTVLRNYWLQVSDALDLDPDFEIYGAKSSVAYSPDGRFVAVAGCREVLEGLTTGTLQCGLFSRGKTGGPFLAIMDAFSGSVVASAPVDDYTWVKSMAFTHDGNRLVYATGAGKLAVWNRPSAKIEMILEEVPRVEGLELTREIAISPDDRWAAFRVINDKASGTGSVKIWDLDSGNLVMETSVKAYKSLFVVAMTYAQGWGPHFSADSRTLLVPADEEFIMYDTSTWSEIGRFKFLCDLRCNLAVSPDLSLLAVLEVESSDISQRPASITIWDLATAEKVRDIGDGVALPGPLTFTPDGQFLLEVNGVGWDVTNDWKLIDTRQNGEDIYYYREFADDGRTFLRWGLSDISLIGLPDPVAAQVSESTSQGTFELPQGRLLLEIGKVDPYEFIRYDVLNLPDGLIELYPFTPIEGMIWQDPSPDFKYWALTQAVGEGANRSQALYMLGPNGDEPTLVAKGEEFHGLAWSPDSRFLAVSKSRDGLYLYDVDSGRLNKVPLKTRLPSYPSFSPDGKSLAFAGEGEYGWYIANVDGSNERIVDETGLSYPRFEWHPDGRRIFIKTFDGATLRTNIYSVFIDSGTAELISDNLDNSDNPRVSPDGKYLAYEEGYTTIHVFDLEGNTAQPRLQIPGSAPVWSPDGKYLVYVSGDRYQYISIMDIQTGLEMQVHEFVDERGSVKGWLP